MTTIAPSLAGDVVHYEQTYSPEPRSAVAARAFVNARLAQHEVIHPDCELVVTELMSNVVKHARTPITVRLDIGPTVRVEVHDSNSIIPAVSEAAADAEDGRGLFIVDALAQRWGVATKPDGKYVWVELARELA